MPQMIDLTADDSIEDDDEGISDDDGDENENSDDEDENSINEDEDTAMTMEPDEALKEIKERFSECFSNPRFGGEMACFEVLQDPVNPGLWIEGIGSVGLPVSGGDVERILRCADSNSKISKGNGKGKGKKGNAMWEIEAGRVELRNPAWERYVDKVVGRMALGMGVGDGGGGGGAGMEVRLVKMAMQSVSAGKSVSLSTPVSESQIGTLAICLPSSHSGGEICFSRSGEEKNFDTSPSSDFDGSMFSWFSDVAVELQPVTLGCRFMLIYSIVLPRKGLVPSASLVQGMRRDFSDAMEMWKKAHESAADEVPGILAWVLEDKIEDESLSLSGLNDRDKQLAHMLSQYCSKGGIYLYLANVTKTVTGACDPPEEWDYTYRCYKGSGDDIVEIDGETDVSILLDTVVTLDGIKFSNDMDVPAESIIQDDDDDPFGDEPDSGDWDEETANHFYKATAIIMVLASYRTHFLLSQGNRRGVDVKSIMETTIRLFEDPVTNPAAEEELLHLSQHIISESRSSQHHLSVPFSDEVLSLAAKGSILVHKPDLDFDLSRLSKETYGVIGAAISKHGFTPFEATLTAGISKVPDFRTRVSVLDNIWNSCKIVKTSGVSVNIPALSRWMRPQTELGLSTCNLNSAEDALCLTGLSLKYGQQFLVTSVIDAVKRNIHSRGFVLKFLDELFRLSETDAVLKGPALSCFRDVLSELIPHFTLRPKTRPNKRQKTTSYSAQINRRVDIDGDQSIEQEEFPYEGIARIIDCCLSASLFEDMDVLATHLTQEISSLVESRSKESKAIVLILDNSMIRLLFSLNLIFTSDPTKLERAQQSSIKQLYKTTLNSYVQLLLNPRPALKPRPKDWKKPRRGCGCPECKKLGQFLVDPETEKAVFQKLKPHLQEQLEGGSEPCHEKFEFELIKTIRPFGLQITKTHKAWEEKDQEWRRLCKSGAGNIRNLSKVGKGGNVILGDPVGDFIEVGTLEKLERAGKGLKVR